MSYALAKKAKTGLKIREFIIVKTWQKEKQKSCVSQVEALNIFSNKFQVPQKKSVFFRKGKSFNFTKIILLSFDHK